MKKILLLALFLIACSSSTPGNRQSSDASVLTEDQTNRFNAMSVCTEMYAERPRVRYLPSSECPQKKTHRCILGTTEAGSYNTIQRVIELPHDSDLGFEHEAIHHLLLTNKRDADKDHCYKKAWDCDPIRTIWKSKCTNPIK